MSGKGRALPTVEARFRSWLCERYGIPTEDCRNLLDVLDVVPATDEGTLLDAMREAFAAGYARAFEGEPSDPDDDPSGLHEEE